MGRGRPVSQFEVRDLPDWSLDLMASRGVLRCEQMFRKSHPKSKGWRLFRELALRLARGENTAALRDPLAELIAEEDYLWRRAAVTTAMAACVAERAERAIESTRFLAEAFTPDLEADRNLHEMTLRHDARSLRACDSPADAKAALISLWPAGEPRWLHTKWATVHAYRRAEARRLARVWGEDAPRFVFAPASLRRIDPSLPSPIRQCFGPIRTLSTFRAAEQVGPFVPRAIRVIQPKAIVRKFSVRTSHTFRGPASDAHLQEFAQRTSGHPKFDALAAFYSLHDGARLFHGRLLEESFSMMILPGLRDQRRALRILTYTITRANSEDPAAVNQFLSRWKTDLEHVHVLAMSTRFDFFVPMQGPHAGCVFRLLTPDLHVPLWSKVPIEGVARIIAEIKTLARRTPLYRPLGDEREERLTGLQLVAVRSQDPSDLRQHGQF